MHSFIQISAIASRRYCRPISKKSILIIFYQTTCLMQSLEGSGQNPWPLTAPVTSGQHAFSQLCSGGTAGCYGRPPTALPQPDVS